MECILVLPLIAEHRKAGTRQPNSRASRRRLRCFNIRRGAQRDTPAAFTGSWVGRTTKPIHRDMSGHRSHWIWIVLKGDALIQDFSTKTTWKGG